MQRRGGQRLFPHLRPERAVFRLKPGAKLVADVSDEGLALRPDNDNEGAEASLVDRDGFLVFTGTEPFDAVEVIMAARAHRDETLSALRVR